MKKNKFDVIIVGGGVIGHSVAYQLSKEKDLSVALIDKYKPGKASWASCGGLWATGESVGLGCGVIFFRTFSAQKKHDKSFDLGSVDPHFMPEYFLQYADKSNDMFPELYEELKSIVNIDMEFRKTGLSFIIYDEADMKYAKNIYAKLQKIKPNLVRFLDKKEVKELEPYVTDIAQGGLLFPYDSDSNPYTLELAFRNAARKQGVAMIEGAEVINITVTNNKVDSVTTDLGDTFACGTLINAAGAWAADIAKMVGITLPIKPIKGQIVLSERLPRILNSCLSTADCYIDQKQHGEVLIGATTEDLGFSTQVTLDKVKNLASGAIRAIPALKKLHIKRIWAGLRPATPDEIPIFGPVSGLDGYLNATGNFRTGIVTAPITGVMLKAFLLGTEQPVDPEPFLYERFASGKVKMDEKASYIPPE